LREAIMKMDEEHLAAWLETATLDPGLCEEIEALVCSREATDRALVGKLRLGYLKCLCPCDPRDTWHTDKRHGVAAVVAATFRGAELVPVIAKMDHMWGSKPGPGEVQFRSRPPYQPWRPDDNDFRGRLDPQEARS
jgi:hypothetical protein